MITILEILQYLLSVVSWIILIQVVLSLLIAFNVVNTTNDFVRSVHFGLERLTEPVYRPIRKLLPDLGNLDLAPMIVLMVIYILNNIVIRNMIISLI